MWWAVTLMAIAVSWHLTMRASGGRGRVRTWFVAAGYTGASDGSAERPFKAIHDAVAAAGEGDTIAVAHGEYDEGTIDLRHKTLTLLGGYAPDPSGTAAGAFAERNWRRTPSTVRGFRSATDYPRDPAAVFLLGGSAGGRIDGFTITGGRHGVFAQYSSSSAPLVIANNVIEDNGLDQPLYYEYGGGIHSEYQSLVVENNIIRRNRSGRGGGIAALGTAEARIDSNAIEENLALGDHGGGLYVQQPAVVRNNLIRANAVTATIVDWFGGVGGGITIVGADVRLSRNVIVDNYAKKCGAGMLVDEGAIATMEHDIVVRNRPVDRDGWGGSGIYVDGGSTRTTRLLVAHSEVVNNAPDGPGIGNGIYVASRAEVTVEESLVRNNGRTPDVAIVDDTGTSFVAWQSASVSGGTIRERH